MAGLNDTPPVGRGFSADDLQKEELKQLAERFTVQLPKLRERAYGVIKNHRLAESAMADLRTAIQDAAGGGAVKLTIDAIGREVDAELAKEKALAQLKRDGKL